MAAALPMLIVDGIGALAGVVGVGMMIPGLLPQVDLHQPVVRVAAGLSWKESDTTSGNQPGISLFDVRGRHIGKMDGKQDRIKDGDFVDISVPFDVGVGKKPVEYISVSKGGNDALCIAYLALTQPDGTKKAWYGDVGKACGANWYHSLLKTGDDDYQPSCIWIDGDKSNGIPHQGLGLHINDFAATEARASQYEDNRDLMCKADPRFKLYEKMTPDDPISYFDPPLDYTPKDLTDPDPKAVLDKKRWKVSEKISPRPEHDKPDWNVIGPRGGNPRNFPRARPAKMDDSTVVISKSTGHSAKELCNSPTSWGHSFVSVAEHLFCDMDQRKLWPLCGGGTNETRAGCFDHEKSKMVFGTPSGLGNKAVKMANTAQPEKTYAKTLHWD